MADECAACIGPETEPYWVLVAALRRFVEGEGRGLLPLEGSIPDMHASTQLYLDLQRLYREKAEADVDAGAAGRGRGLLVQGAVVVAVVPAYSVAHGFSISILHCIG